ncbi:MAG: GAF domain-containing protein [Desulfobulbaceae bacterium]|nr:GAF domain-containing protein [Desulfobulbaceae bacterium]
MTEKKTSSFRKQENTCTKNKAHSELTKNFPSGNSNPFYTILENLDAVVFVTDMQSCEILYANKFAKDLFGEISGELCWQTLQKGLSAPCSFCSNIDIPGPNGKPKETITYELHNPVTGRWYEVHERAVELYGEKTVRIHFATDVTDKKKVDSELSISEEKYRTVADYTYDWECWIREDRSFEYISPSCERITGYRADEFLSNPDLLISIIHPQDRLLFERHHQQAFTSPEYNHLRFRVITRAGDERWISHYCQPVYRRDGTFLGRRSSNRDITIRIESERKTKLNELRLSTLVELYERKDLPNKVICDFVLDSSLPISSSTVGFLGFLNNEETVMTIHAWSKAVMRKCTMHRESFEFNVPEAGIWGEAVRQRQPIIINDFSLPSPLKRGTPEGHVKIKRFLAVPLMYDNRVVAVLAVGNKEENYTDDDAGELHLLLEGMWQILLKKKAEEELARQSEKTKHLINAVSHDLKSPTISIHGFATLLKEKYMDVLDERGLKYCEQIITASEQITALAEDINTYISSKDNGWQFETLELGELWNTVREEFFPQLQRKNVTWRVSERDRVMIRGNKMGLLRIFRNLIDNALKYGGDSLTEIVLGYQSSDEYHILTVENNGEIIMPEDEKIIFEEFARKVKDPHIYGTGLGLAIVREIARKHQGNSWLTTSKRCKPVFCISISRHL